MLQPYKQVANRSDSRPAQPVRPFIRWAGSKRLLVPHLRRLIPAFEGTYFEPFLGGGSLFLDVQPRRAVLGDALDSLVAAWSWVKRDPAALARRVFDWPRDRETFYLVRELAPTTQLEHAARFLYLNQNAYGGLWRVNSDGHFNVPWSAPKTESVLNTANLNAVSRLLRKSRATLLCGDFSRITRRAIAGDLVFLDPPYSLGRPSRPFVHYNTNPFSWDDQVRLAREAHRLANLGVHVLATNSAHPDVESLYQGFLVEDVSRSNSFATRATQRSRINERIFISQ